MRANCFYCQNNNNNIEFLVKKNRNTGNKQQNAT